MKFYDDFNGILYKNSYPSKSSSVSVTAISPWNLEQTLKVTKGMIILMQAYYPDFHGYLNNSTPNLCLILEQLLEKWLSLGRVPTCPGESKSRWTPSPTPQKVIDSIWNEYCEGWEDGKPGIHSLQSLSSSPNRCLSRAKDSQPGLTLDDNFQIIRAKVIFNLQRVNSSISVSGRNESQTLKSVKLP